MFDSELDLVIGKDAHQPLVSVDSIRRALAMELEGKNILPPPLKDYSRGMAAIAQTSERASADFFSSVKNEYRPDGYIVGVGAGTIFSLIDCFPYGREPKGIIIADANLQVVAFSQFMIETLQMDLNQEGFSKNFFELSEMEYKNRLDRVIRSNRIIKRRIKDVPGGNIYFPSPMSSVERKHAEHISHHRDDIDVIGAIMRNLSLLQQLARQEKMAAVCTDFANSSFIDAVMKLPDFKTLTNLIYSSNIATFFKSSDISKLEDLKKYEKLSNPQVFIAARHSKDLYLEAGTSVPVYNRENQ